MSSRSLKQRGVAPGAQPFNLRKTEVWLVISIVLFVGFLGAAGAVTGWNTVAESLSSLRLWPVVAIVVAAVLNNGIRFWRWKICADALHLKVPTGRFAVYYVAGMALLATPGKIGTALRLWFLHKHHRVPYRRSTPLMLMDTLTDFMGMMLLIAFSLPALGSTGGTGVGLALLAGLMGVAISLFVYPPLLRRTLKIMYFLSGKRKPRLFASMLRLLRAVRTLLGPKVLAQTVLLSTVAWAIMGAGIWALVSSLGTPISLTGVLFTQSVSIMLGALTMLPGGLGGTEATMVILFSHFGLPGGTAVVATGLARLLSLWLSVVAGFVALPFAMAGTRTK